jgi:5-methylthioadenosine/S-adenosylhomocysteine deaminase
MADLIIRNGVIVTMGSPAVVLGDIAVSSGRIVMVGEVSESASEVIDAEGALVLPGLVQAHVHLCQTLFRGLGDDVDVVDWLRGCVWPMEQVHDKESMAASCRLGISELLLSGTTTALSMETVHHTDESFIAAEQLGIRAFIGKALMDRQEPGTDMYGESTADALRDIRRLVATWHGAAEGRLHVALSPRCPRGATAQLWRTVVDMATEFGLVIHTHVGESRPLADLAGTTPDGRDVVMLDRMGALNSRIVLAHCVWPDSTELDLIESSGANVCHCPSANMKLASGFAPIPTYLERGINVAIGADGAACNNNLDGFNEMRLAALIHKPVHGPKAMPSEKVFEMATLGGARALGIESHIGSLEIGKLADVVILWPRRARNSPAAGGDPISELVYSRSAADVRTVLVGGRTVVCDGVLSTADEGQIVREAEVQRELMLERVQLAATLAG